MDGLQWDDIQGLVRSAYGHLSCATYLLLQVTDPRAAGEWLGQLADEITLATGKQPGSSLNVALTCAGLARLGLDRDALQTFPSAFRDGMTSARRTKILRDDGANDPQRWQWGGPGNEEVHILLMIFADEDKLDAQLERQRATFGKTGGIKELFALTAGREPDSREHFGFNDGIGQPVIEGSGNRERQLGRTGHVTEVKPGEFILGYVDEYGTPSNSPTVAADRDRQNLLPVVSSAASQRGAAANGSSRHDLGWNGSYLVFRQMAQDVARFWQFLDRATRRSDGQSDPDARERLAAKLVGRWGSGAPLVLHPDRDPNAGTLDLSNANNFNYGVADPHGFACPIGAHIRRANPSDSLGSDPQTALRSARRHRLLRRGRSYGNRLQNPLQDDGQERGLLFICLNADIERQFEFVQQTWINNPVFGGLSREVDPLIGAQPLGGSDELISGNLTVQNDPIRTRVPGLGRFVTVKGGAYFFLPGLKALTYLSSLSRAPR